MIDFYFYNNYTNNIEYWEIIMSINCGLQIWTDLNLKGNSHPFIEEDFFTSENKSSANKIKKNIFLKSYEDSLNLCFLEKPQLIKFDSNSTDEDIDNFLNSL